MLGSDMPFPIGDPVPRNILDHVQLTKLSALCLRPMLQRHFLTLNIHYQKKQFFMNLNLIKNPSKQTPVGYGISD